MAETDLDEPRDEPKDNLDPLPDPVIEKKRTRKPRRPKAKDSGLMADAQG